MNAIDDDGDDLRSVIESSLRLAHEVGNAQIEDLLMMALLSLGPRGAETEAQLSTPRSVADVVRLMAVP